MAIVVATLTWQPTPDLPKLVGIDLEDNECLGTILPFLKPAQTEMATYISPTLEKVPYHGPLCNGSSPMVLMRTMIVRRNTTLSHRPLTMSWGQRWTCPSCGKTTAAPDNARSGHDRFRAMDAFSRVFKPDFTYTVPA